MDSEIMILDLQRRIDFLNEIVNLFTFKEEDTDEIKNITNKYREGLFEIISFLNQMKDTVSLDNKGVKFI